MTPDGGFRTGDLGYIDDDGFLFIVGRVKEQFKLENGKFVAPAPLEESLQLSPYIQQAMIYGHNKPFDVVLVVPEFGAVAEHLHERGMDVPDRKHMANSEDVKRLIESEVQKYSREWRSYERPRAVQLVSEEWSTDNEMLTPTMKLKRNNIIKNYQDQLENMYRRHA